MQSVPHGDLPEVTRERDLRVMQPDGSLSDLAAVAVIIGERVSALMRLVHYTDVVPEGRQWTIPLALDCGFDGELVIRVRTAGDCERSNIMATLNGGL